jgi:hypothetical protein
VPDSSFIGRQRHLPERSVVLTENCAKSSPFMSFYTVPLFKRVPWTDLPQDLVDPEIQFLSDYLEWKVEEGAKWQKISTVSCILAMTQPRSPFDRGGTTVLHARCEQNCQELGVRSGRDALTYAWQPGRGGAEAVNPAGPHFRATAIGDSTEGLNFAGRNTNPLMTKWQNSNPQWRKRHFACTFILSSS